jgi:hypothetical protein
MLTESLEDYFKLFAAADFLRAQRMLPAISE